MKTHKQSATVILARTILVAMITIFVPIACQDDEVLPQQEEKEIDLPGSGSTGTDFTITSNNVTETTDGFEFTGKLGSKDDDGKEFEIGEGEFKVITGPGGDVEKISGTGMPRFPNIGVFAELLKEFAFNEIMAHIEFATGKYYKDTYGTDIPLDDATKYIHFKVLNEARDGEFELRHKTNAVIYNFYDMYIDPHDPALFFKVQLWKPGKSPNPNGVVSKFWKRILGNLKTLGKEAVAFGGAPNMIFGISNHAKFHSTEYEFNITDKEAFKEQYGFDRFESLNSHLYLKLKGVPIPETVVLRLSGEMYIHEPVKTLTPSPEEVKEKKLNAFLDWFREGEDQGKAATFAGSMDPGGKGIGIVLMGVLPKINDVVGRDIFSDDLNLDIIGATLQFEEPGPLQIETNSYLRFGGQVNKPIIMDIFGDGIKKYFISTPGSSNYFYFSAGPTLDDCSVFIENSTRLVIPAYGEAELAKSHFLINKDGLNFAGKMDLPLGPLHLSNELKGKFSGSGYELETNVNKDITLANGIVLASKDLHVLLSSQNGITVDGSVVMPLGLGEGDITGTVSKTGMSFAGSLKAGTMLDLGNGLKLPTANMTFSSSTDPNEGIHFEGNLTVPHGIGSVLVKGDLTKNGYSFTGITNSEIPFGSVKLLSKSGTLTVSNTDGIYFKSEFALGSVFGNRMMEGHITANEIDLTGSFTGGIPISGHTFTFAGGKLTASSSTGVTIKGSIDLYVFKTNVSGVMTGFNNFLLSGSTSYNGTYFKSSINVDVKPTAVALKGTGKVYGLLGNELYSGTITFKPDWGAKTISACYGNTCFGL